MKIAIGQINPTVGDLPTNRAKILQAMADAQAQGADLLVLPELALLGYPPRDLLLQTGFLDQAEKEFLRIVEASENIPTVIGHVLRGGTKQGNELDPSAAAFGGTTLVYNAAFLLADATIVGHQAKYRLPSFDVFEEERYFTPASNVSIVSWKDTRVGLSVCEDLWYEGGVLQAQAEARVDLLINVSASPFFVGKPGLRHRLAARWAERACAPCVYANLVGAQDELVFDGASFVIRPDGAFLLAAPAFEEGVFLCKLAGSPVAPPSEHNPAQIHDALVLGIRDYVEKNGLAGAVVGVSGGVDSAVVAALACRALGADRVLGAFLPGPPTSDLSRELAHVLAENLGIRLVEIPIGPVLESFVQALWPHLPAAGLVLENLQARIRGVVLMALANATRRIVLCPANKSEVAMGYNTLYGDTVGALAPIGDLVKQEVYNLARWINDRAGREVIPAGILERPPTAELRPGQRDDQDLPPYQTLDPLVQALIVENLGFDDVARQFGVELAREAHRRLRSSEYKRKQLPLVLKVSPKAFGIGRRIPITHKFQS